MNIINEIDYNSDDSSSEDTDVENIVIEAKEDDSEDDDADEDEGEEAEEVAGEGKSSGQSLPKWYKKDTPINKYLKHFSQCLKANRDFHGINVEKSIKRGNFILYSGDPTSLTLRALNKGTNPGADFFYIANAPIIVWDPELIYEKLLIPCIAEGCKGQCTRKNYCRAPRRVIGLSHQYYLWSVEYRYVTFYYQL